MGNLVALQVMVFDADESFREALTTESSIVCGDCNVLPRASVKEIEYALRFISPSVFVVRASQLIKHVGLDHFVWGLHARGTDIVVIQDGKHKFTHSSVSFGRLHYVTDIAPGGELHRLLVLVKLQEVSSIQNQRVTLHQKGKC